MPLIYSLSRSQDALRRVAKATRATVGTLPPLSAIFPDQLAPVVRAADGEREPTMTRWGFPPPPGL